ncbi:polysaccharide deacetylase family protein [Streptomyces sp. NPDC001796]|uniref:polysaccharide deacetylase family protein n=1 Tax=Streptomyces sp. NPDC001796 TaxID=3364609 RepID=UPI00368D2D61
MTAAAITAAISGAVLTACGPHAGGHLAQSSPSSVTPPAKPASPGPHPPSQAPSPSSASPSAPVPGGAAGGTQSGRTGGSAAVPSGPASQPGPAHTYAQLPSAPAGSDMVVGHGVVGGGKSVALTFDDGPDPRWTPQVLALLAQHHAKATFCEIGPLAQRYPYLTSAIVANGDRLCDHSVHHDEQQSRKPVEYNIREIVDAKREITNAAGDGAKLMYYRAPGGDWSPTIRAIAGANHLQPLGWSDDANDWRRPGVDGILRNINQDLRPGTIILMHDGGGDRSQTVQALARLLNQLDAQGYSYGFPA